MAEEEFEIDIYGDANNNEQSDNRRDEGNSHDEHYHGEEENRDYDERHPDDMDHSETHDQSSSQHHQQGVKRKEAHDDHRPVDPGATSAIMISDLNWWNTDDEIRGWARQANCEDELKDITFSEHKVNGKCKG
jgi:hypothetical protein